MKDVRFQRIGATSNTSVGRAFENAIREHYAKIGIHLQPSLAVPVGVGDQKKLHRFDLGSIEPPIIVECKSHTWTVSGNSPSAKLTAWNEAMYYFHVAPVEFRKVLFVLKHEWQGRSLASHYARIYGHLIPNDVELWELDIDSGSECKIR